MQEQPDIWVQITVPNEFQKVGKFNIGVTAATEGDICPPDWIDKINQMNITIVPSEFTKQVILNTAQATQKSVTSNIQVVPEYFDETCYDNSKPLIELTGIDQVEESFAFLSVGHWLQGNLGQDRKDISGMIYTFFNTFKNQTSAPALILKTSGATYSVTDRFEVELELSTRQRYYAITNFSKKAVSKRYDELIEIIDKGTESIPMQQDLKLPKLNLPKLQKV
jgi:hypothetical protein